MPNICETIIKDKEALRELLLRQTRSGLNQTGFIIDGKIQDIKETKKEFSETRSGKPIIYTATIRGEEDVPPKLARGTDIVDMIDSNRPYICKLLRGYGVSSPVVTCFEPKHDDLYNLAERMIVQTRLEMAKFESEIEAAVGKDKPAEGTFERALLDELKDRINRLKYAVDKLAPELVNTCSIPLR